METFYYYERARLHLCNSNLYCSDEDYEKLVSKGKIDKYRVDILNSLQKYQVLTIQMLMVLLKREKEELSSDLQSLMEYGLIIKQFYVYFDEDIEEWSATFYCVSPRLPRKVQLKDKKNDFCWSKDLFMPDVMGILAFNQFHLAFIENIPKKAYQTQLQYHLRGATIDGRYILKGKHFHLGYSHLCVHAIRDFGHKNTEAVELMQKIYHTCTYQGDKQPWFIFICEHKRQCAYIDRKIRANPETRGIRIYFLLDTDIAYDENPLCYLQTYRFMDGEREVKSEIFKVNEWF